MNMKKLYHYTKFDTAIKILESHSLRFGRLHNMNDIHENDKLSYTDLSGSPINSFPSDVLDAIDCEMAKYRQLSFTADSNLGKLGFDLHQMWGLYADKGQGVCFVFDRDILCKQMDDAVLHEAVSYDPAVESFCIAISNDTQSVQQEIHKQTEKFFFHKRKEWEHEQEYRFVKRCPNLKKEEYLNYGEALKYIILNSVIEDVDCVKFNEIVEKLNSHAPKVPILVYGNGLLDYSLYDIHRTDTIWPEDSITKKISTEISDEERMNAVKDEFGAEYTADGSKLITIPDHLTSYEIKAGTKVIGEEAFWMKQHLVSILIPNSVASMGQRAFCYCSSLLSVTIPESITYIDNAVFKKCTSLQSVTIPNSVHGIGNDAFYGCKSLQSITIPDSVTSIGFRAFAGCKSLQSIVISKNARSLLHDVFGGCSSLQVITILNSNIRVYGALKQCTALREIRIPQGTRNKMKRLLSNDCNYHLVEI